MMKSFFKKLAFVMALAMVVTTAAPAALSAYAADALVIAEQNEAKADAKTEYGVAVDDTIDLKFYGAAEGWQKIFVWSSLNEDIASVDQTGLVKGLKDGEATIKLTIGEQVATVKVVVGKGNIDLTAFTAEMSSDSVATLTFNDTSITAADLKDGLSFFYYVAADYPVYVPLVEKIEGKDGVFTATLYEGVTFQDGTVYGFEYNGVKDEFTCIIGTVSYAQLTVNGKINYLVEVSDTEYTFGAKLYNESGKDITTTALASGVYVEYEVSEDEDGKYYPAGDTGILFDEVATATVKVSAYVLDEDGEPVTLVNALAFPVTAKNPDPYDITFQTPAFSIVDDAESVNWTKALNNKIAVGDDGYELAVKLTDNKNKAVATTEYYIGSNGLQSDAWGEGEFSFKSTNVSKLYVTEDGQLMPNEKGNVTVLVYYTPLQTGEETPVAKIVAAINLNVQAARAVGDTSLSVANKTLSTVNVNGSNKTDVTLNVVDTLGDKVGVEGVEAKIELTTAAASLKNGATAPALSAEKVAVSGGKAVFTITADATTLPTASKSQTYSYKITVGTKTETFTITVKSPASDTVFSKYSLIFGGAKKIEDGTSVDNLKLTVGLAGISNGVAAAKLGLFDAKLKAEDAVAGNYYYVVTKDGVDITEKLTGAATAGTLSINLTTTKDVEIKETTTSEAETIKVVDLNFGAGKYAVTAYEVKTDSKGNPYFKQLTGAKDTCTVEYKLDSAAFVDKIVPEYEGTSSDVVAAVKNCFKFTVGSKTFDAAEDYDGYKIVIDENVLSDGDVCYVNSVTFYMKSKVAGEEVYINCGTVAVNDYITFVK